MGSCSDARGAKSSGVHTSEDNFYIMDSIRRKLHRLMIGRKDVAKAVSLSLFVKSRYKSSVINDFTYAKMHRITGLSISSLKRRIGILKGFGLVKFIGTNGQHLCFLGLCSGTKHRNIDISYFVYDSIEDCDRSVFASFLVEIQRKKDFAKHAIQKATVSGRTVKEIKAAKRSCKRYGYGREYHEFGISMKRIARDMGVCVKTALEIVRWAVEQHLIEREHCQKQKYVKGIVKLACFLDGMTDFTFCTKDNEYYILASHYSLTTKTALSIG